MPWFTQRNPPEEGEEGSKWKIRFIPQRWLLIKEQVDVAAELKAFFSSLPCFFSPRFSAGFQQKAIWDGFRELVLWFN